MKSYFQNFLGGAPTNPPPVAASLRVVAWTVLPIILLLTAFILETPSYTHPRYAPASWHRIRNSRPGGLRPSTLPLGHWGSPQYWVSHVDGEETFCFFRSFETAETGNQTPNSSVKRKRCSLGPPPCWRQGLERDISCRASSAWQGCCAGLTRVVQCLRAVGLPVKIRAPPHGRQLENYPHPSRKSWSLSWATTEPGFPEFFSTTRVPGIFSWLNIVFIYHPTDFCEKGGLWN